MHISYKSSILLQLFLFCNTTLQFGSNNLLHPRIYRESNVQSFVGQISQERLESKNILQEKKRGVEKSSALREKKGEVVQLLRGHFDSITVGDMSSLFLTLFGHH